MNKRLWVIVLCIAALVVIYLVVIHSLKYRLNEFLNDQSQYGIQITHEGIDLEIFKGSACFTKPDVQLTEETNIGFVGEMALDRLQINDIEYLKLLFYGDLNIESIALDRPQADLKTKAIDSTLGSIDSMTKKKLGLDIKLEDLVLNESQLTIRDGPSDSLLLSIANFDLDVSNIEISDRTLANSIPFTGDDYQIRSDSVFIKVNAFENLTLSSVEGDHNYTAVAGLTYETKYSKPRLDAMLDAERDHYQIAIDAVEFHGLGLQSLGSDQISFTAQKIGVTRPEVAMYRNKLLPDKHDERSLYGSMLRTSPINIAVDSFLVREAKFSYLERSKPENEGGRLEFNALDVDVLRLGNAYQENTEIHLDARFMNHAPFNATWSFNVADVEDAFTFKGELHNLYLEDLNTFTQPYANTGLEGEINALYFSIYGDEEASTLDLRCTYDDVKVYLLKPGTNKRKKLLSALVNIFVSRDSEHGEQAYEKVSVKVQRDKTKSPWNYIFKNIEAGMQELLL